MKKFIKLRLFYKNLYNRKMIKAGCIFRRSCINSNYIVPLHSYGLNKKKYNHYPNIIFISCLVISITIGLIVLINNVSATWNNTIVWTTKEDFDNNAATTGTPTTNDLNLADTTTVSGDISLVKPSDNGVTISANANYSLVVKNDGTLWATGYDDNYNFGLGEMNHSDRFIQIASDVSAVSDGNSTSSFLIKRNGDLYGTGANNYGVLGLGTNSLVKSWTKTSLSNVKKISNFRTFSIALKTDGTVWVTGRGANGQFGDGTTSRLSWTQVTNSNINDGTVVDIAAGNASSYIVKADGTLWVTGLNSYGQLGLGDTTQRTTWTQAASLSDVKSVKAYETTALVLKNDGTVWGAGSNIYGQLGIGRTGVINLWEQSNISNVSVISMGANHALAIKTDGSLWSVGYGAEGALGNGNSINRTSWVATGITNIQDVSAGLNHSVIRKTDGSIMLAGTNMYGQVGSDRDVIYGNTWQLPQIVGQPIKLSSGGDGSSQFVVLNDDTLYGVGRNTNASLGLGHSLITSVFTKSLISDIKKAYTNSSVSNNANFSAVLKNDGTVWVVGNNTYGQYGDGTTTVAANWKQSNISGVDDISASNSHLMARKTDNTVWVAGYNNNGQLGIGNTTNQSNWVQISGIDNISSITAGPTGSMGSANSFIITSNGDLWASGLNSSYQLGFGNNTVTTTFTKSSAISNVSKVWASNNHTVAKKTDGTIWVVGNNSNGQLGLGDKVNKTSWVQLPDFTNAIDVAVADGKTFIIKADNTLWAAGQNMYGELATPTYGDFTTFTQIATGVTVAGVSNYNSIIIKDGSVYTAGINRYGGLGINLIDNSVHYDFENSLTNIKASGGYYATGTISGLKINAGDDKQGKWNTISWTGSTPAGTSIKFRTRGAATEEGLADATWSDYYTTSGSSITTANSQWLEAEMTISSIDGVNSPVLEDFSINYFSDTTVPTNPTGTALAWTSSSKNTVIESGENKFTNDAKPYFEFSGANDEVEGSGIKGYYIYFGSSDSADPYTAGVYQNTLPNDPQSFEPANNLTSDGPYYLRVRTIDNALNKSEAITIFIYNFDKTAPTSPSFVLVSPFGWSTTNKFTFIWDSGSDEALYASKIYGYQYKIGGTINDWSSGVSTTTNLSVNDIESYQNGQNVFYVRSIDNAGNVGDAKQVYFYYNGEAPSVPQNLTVNPQSQITENSFTFEWDKPASYNGDIKGYRYSINALPQANNTTFINLSSLPPEVSYNQDTGHIILSNIPAATLQGNNYFYVVAVDTNDNVMYGNNSAVIGFDCNTPAPGTPTSVEIFDTSNRDNAVFSVAIKWRAPNNKGVGFKDYTIERSTDGISFNSIGKSGGVSFIDAGTDDEPLQSITYYYRIFTNDNSGNSSAESQVVSIKPTGKYTSPPQITIEPEVISSITTATVRWVTDREASSFIAFSEQAEFDPTKGQQGQQDNTVDHIVKLAGLKPDTLYHYKVIYTDSDGNSNVNIAEDHIFRTLPAPRIENVTVLDIRLDTAIVSWFTSEPAKSDIIYGKTTKYGTVIENVSGGATTVHSVRLESLDHSSTYHFAIRIKDADGNEIISDDYSFDTLMFPKVSNVRFEPVKDSSTATMKITWETNVPTNSIVKFQPEGGSVQESVKSALELTHEIVVSGLLDNKFYQFYAVGNDQYGNQAVSDAQQIKTDYDTRPPAIFNVTSEVSSTDFGSDARSQLVVSWETDEPATSQVEYGLGSTGDNYETKSQEDTGLTTSHVVVLTGLKPSSAYHFRTISSDGSGNTSLSAPQPLLTSKSRSSIIDIIVGGLQSSIGWLFGVEN